MSDAIQTRVHVNSLRLFAHPVFSEGLRVFFPLAAAYGFLMIFLWGLVLSTGISFAPAGNAVFWHRYDMLFGFVTAALAGFLLTATPAWSGRPRIAGAELAGLAALWLAGRVALWALPVIGAGAVTTLHIAFFLWLLGRTATALWTTNMRNLLWPVVLFLAGLVLASRHVLFGGDYSIFVGVRLAEGAILTMVLTSLAPISMVIVNDAITKSGREARFIPRPPMRHIAQIAVILHTLADAAALSEQISGWLALAAGCAVLNVLTDWHRPGALSTPFSRGLYAVYPFMAGGLFLVGLSGIDVISPHFQDAGRHLYMVGGISLAIFMVLSIAGLRHTGRPLRMATPIKAAIILLMSSALARAGNASLWIDYQAFGMALAWICYSAAFAIYLCVYLPYFLRENAPG